ncbi:regulatory protein RecX [Neptunomonas sp.]|uniref:regulatory protein RecX n=1 Tax=Neptunomonas sp. TaxID=1971898 RepID=UPI0025ED2873|nr:regulatory protein RecX [Neptunomonas sp.]
MEAEAEIRCAVISLLARREYSRAEIEQKYRNKYDEELLTRVLDKCQENGYQSDQRFAEMLVRSKTGQGYGLLRILQEGKRKGINESLLKECIQEQQPDWFELATLLSQRKFKEKTDKQDRKLYEKRVRFLLSRGFSYEQAKYALELANNEME